MRSAFPNVKFLHGRKHVSSMVRIYRGKRCPIN